MVDALFPATRQEAQARLVEFLELVPSYAVERNYVRPGHGNVSRLSPAIRHRLLTEEEVVGAVLARHSFSRSEKFLQEVCWRSYWKGWLELRPGVWRRYLAAVERLQHEVSPALQARLQALCEGTSPSGIMNEFSRELLRTGYLHNHARMWWASYWIHHQQLPWELGAAHLFSHLLDADPASNTLSWRWVAGLQTPGKTYLARTGNITKYCAPELLSKAGGIGLAEEVEPVSISEETAPETPANEDPFAPCSLNKALSANTALLLHDEDFSLENSPLRRVRPHALLQFAPALPTSEPLARWRQTAREDAAGRAQAHFGLAPLRCATPQEIRAACEAGGITTLALIRPAVGPLRDALHGLAGELAAVGVRLHAVRRSWDEKLTPLARRGFFPFWEKVGGRLRKHGLEGWQ